MEKTKLKKLHRVSCFKTMRRLYAAGAIYQTMEWDEKGLEATAVFEDEKLCLAILDKHRRGDLYINSKDFDLADDELKGDLHPRR